MIAFVHAPTLIGLGIGVALSKLLSRFSWPRWLHWTPRTQAFKAVDSDSVRWMRNQLGHESVTYFMKLLFEEPRTGERVLLVRYPPGEINPSHSHSVAHGMYVLRGTLVTHRGTFGPNTFVWFPPREVMWHGAAPEEELVVLLIAGRHLATRYAKQAGAPAEPLK